MSFLEMLTARLAGRKIGRDRYGNTYFESRRLQPVYNRTRRFVVTPGAQEATKVPPEWHAWLHHQIDALPDASLPPPRRWEKEARANLTGTRAAYRPAGSLEAGGSRAAATGDYEAWSPDAS